MNFLSSYESQTTIAGISGGIIALIVVLIVIDLILIAWGIGYCQNTLQIITVLFASLFGFLILIWVVWKIDEINKNSKQKEKKNQALENLKLKYIVERNWKEPEAKLQAIKDYERAERKERERKIKLEKERIEKERIEKERQIRLEKERIEREKQERLELEKIIKKHEQLEKEKFAKEKQFNKEKFEKNQSLICDICGRWFEIAKVDVLSQEPWICIPCKHNQKQQES